MKKIYLYTILLFSSLFCTILISCNDFLDREPLSSIAPESYFENEDQVTAYVNEIYDRVMPKYSGNSYGLYETDKDRKTRSHTDNFGENNVKCLIAKGICRFVPHSSAGGF